ncbi:hypothetical protein FJT64_018290 [Amphibalanus amphitrite]|uniref:Uncharacterized protein n=1 Tax=Amphibalanus amphitrite TaxID=1232801 RepID=A0A6A4X3X3_AMPAM|nr:hypothetical protein FJT64_018290 [Amphibalanus amphitrite]
MWEYKNSTALCKLRVGVEIPDEIAQRTAGGGGALIDKLKQQKQSSGKRARTVCKYCRMSPPGLPSSAAGRICPGHRPPLPIERRLTSLATAVLIRGAVPSPDLEPC